VKKTYYRNKILLEKIGARMKKIREEKGISQEEMANELGFNQGYISKFESGQRNSSVSHVAAFAKMLNISVCSLFESE
jgi:transcriptional regulator with XRE-family HTH domain